MRRSDVVLFQSHSLSGEDSGVCFSCRAPPRNWPDISSMEPDYMRKVDPTNFHKQVQARSLWKTLMHWVGFLLDYTIRDFTSLVSPHREKMLAAVMYF